MRSVRINKKWFKLDSMAELTEYLQSMPAHELTMKVATDISEDQILESPRRLIVENFILLSKGFMSQLYEEIRPELEKHSLKYPFIKIHLPFVDYESSKGRLRYQRVQSWLRGVPRLGGRYSPKQIRDPIVPIVLPGVDYSAESLVRSYSLASESLPDKSVLGWQHLDAYADYCLGVMALGREAYSSLVDAWYYGNDSDAYFKGLETIAEEMLHHVSDEIAGPRYGEKAIAREHYWMKSYGEFPEKIDIALLRLKDEYLGRMKRSLEERLGTKV